MQQWRTRKNIPNPGTGTGRNSSIGRDSPVAAFSPWTENQVIFKREDPEPDMLMEADLDLLAERNYECLMDYNDTEPKEKLTYWQQQRQKEEEEIKKINFDHYIQRQNDLEAEEAEFEEQR